MATRILTPAICGPRTLPDPCGSRPGAKDIVLDGVVGDVRLKDENGAVELHVTKPGSMQVENRNGDIQIFLPDKAASILTPGRGTAKFNPISSSSR